MVVQVLVLDRIALANRTKRLELTGCFPCPTGGNPYPGVEIDELFVEKLKQGYRMDKPTFASDQM